MEAAIAREILPGQGWRKEEVSYLLFPLSNLLVVPPYGISQTQPEVRQQRSLGQSACRSQPPSRAEKSTDWAWHGGGRGKQANRWTWNFDLRTRVTDVDSENGKMPPPPLERHSIQS